jgi:hypothetical protein
MSKLVDKVFAEVCLDERVKDGIFNIEEEEHMDALRDYFLKKGIPKEAVREVTNLMVEKKGNFPDRQAWRKEDGILVTWPSPQHMTKAFANFPGKYTHQDPNPGPAKPPAKQEPIKREPPEKEEDDEKGKEGEEGPKEPKGAPVFPQSDGKEPTVKQGDKELEVEPPGGEKTSVPSTSPTLPPAPRTPQRIAAEKEVAKQIMFTDDSALTKIEPQLNEICTKQLGELLKYADKQNYREAILFLIKYVNL